MYILKSYYNSYASIICYSKIKKDLLALLKKKGYKYCKADDTYNKKRGYKKYDTCKIEQVENINDAEFRL